MSPIIKTSDRFPVRRRIRLSRSISRDGRAFFITVTTHGRYHWFLHHRDLTEAGIGFLGRLAIEHGCCLYAWCFMPDHLHLLIQAPDVVALVRRFKGRLTPFARRLEPDRRLWRRSFYDHALRREEDLQKVAAYVWENPVRAGIVASPPAYRWSGSAVWPDWRESYASTDPT